MPWPAKRFVLKPRSGAKRGLRPSRRPHIQSTPGRIYEIMPQAASRIQAVRTSYQRVKSLAPNYREYRD